MIARINNDMTLTQFEQSAINLVKDVEDLYWDLYLAYRKWDAAVTARNSAQKSWRDTKVILDGGGKQGFTNSDEPLARDRYYQTRAQSEAALSELYRTETALRRLLGLPASDGTVLRPSDEPVTARFEPNWEANLVEALTHRVELRRQRWSLQSVKLQLKAARSLIRPRLDLVGGYQVNALGDNLFSNNRTSPFSSGYRGLSHADHTGWNLGFEFTLPLGMRSANAQVRNLELRLAKARAVLEAQESEVSHELSDAIQQLAAHQSATQSNLNRRAAAQERVRQFEIEVFNAGTKTLDDLLRAQVSRADAEVAYYTSLVAYNQALANLHYRTGGLLAVNNVQLAESEWTPEAYRDALRRAWERSHGLETDDLLEERPIPFVEPVPESEPKSTTGTAGDQESPRSPGDPTVGPSDPVDTPADRGVVPAAYHDLVDRLRQGTRRLGNTGVNNPDASSVEPPAESVSRETPSKTSRISATYHKLADRLRQGTRRPGVQSDSKPDSSSVEPPVEEVAPGTERKTSRIPAAYQDLVDRIRKAKQRFRDRSNPTPVVSPPEPEKSQGSRERSSRHAGPSSRQKLVESIWNSKRSGEDQSTVGPSLPKSLAPGGSSRNESAVPGVTDDAFRLPM